MPARKEIIAAHGVSASTAGRAISLLRKWGMVTENSRGAAATVTGLPPARAVVGVSTASPTVAEAESTAVAGVSLLELRVLHLGQEVRKLTVEADPGDPSQLRRLLIGAARRHGGEDADLIDYELEVRRAGETELITTFVAL